MTTSPSAFVQLGKDCREQLLRSYAAESREQAEQRLDRELVLIEHHGHLETFRTAAKLSGIAATEGFFLRLRGSGPCSLICYLLGLTDVDPLRHDLPAERLLGSARQVTLCVLIDPRQADQIRRFTDRDPGVGQCLWIRPASDVELIPHGVAAVLRKKCDPAFRLRSLPLVDPRTGMLLIQNSLDELVGFASDEFWRSLRQLKTCRLETIAALLAAHEEAAAQDGIPEQFLWRSAREHPPELLEALLPGVMTETHGLLLYQEQIMLALFRLGKIPLREGYEFVKLVVRRSSIEPFQERFLTGATNHGLSADDADRVFSELAHAARRVSCKAHQLTTALTIWQAAFLKTHFPREFSQALRQTAPANP